VEPETEAKTEVKSPVLASAPEEKTSAVNTEIERQTEEKTSAKPKRIKRYDGSGRRNTDEEIDVILDAYLQYGILPHDVSDRQRRDYKKHPRMELRRMYLEQAGLIKKGRTGTKGKTTANNPRGTNVLPYRKRQA